ncbi:hypothetical protein C6V04_04885 [Burkholderia multivorans]|uniref:hypothetical protein n=1 Tax=Burkholderia cepacia complex TaxID=87882 RepID=UPI000CFE90BD|nr:MULTISPECIES: hypothetical protein [Burkholderia cepacia complex]MBR8084603.1 hypothetical protein [Burkholderia vietnamiensis]PRG96540.1 hypothetical protein C6V04_04885 [Burkholderia multivorans]
MNWMHQSSAEGLITWKRAKRDTRGLRIARRLFRVFRNVLAVLGVFFVYLLVLGYFQYQDQAAQTEVQCAVSRCM